MSNPAPSVRSEPEYDVAISFLHRDEPLALQLFNRLAETFRVFVYSKRQEKLAGTDGLETFRRTFRSDSRLVVVLYRDGWGKTPWTRVEEQAIQDRFLKEGWNWLLFATLDANSALPLWLPETRVRLSFEDYGFEQLVGAIRGRAQELGSISHKEDLADRARRVEREAAMRAEREQLLTSQGMEAVQSETQIVFSELLKRAEDLADTTPSLGIEMDANRSECVINTSKSAINLYPYFTHPVTESRLVMREWPHRLILPKDSGRKAFLFTPRHAREVSFYFDYRPEYGGWCWTNRISPHQYRTSTELAEHCLELLLDVHDKVSRGELKPPGFEDW